MANQKVKHIIAKLVGQSTESTLDVYDVDAVHTDKIANNLTTTSSGYVLDARQGKVLSDYANGILTNRLQAKLIRLRIESARTVDTFTSSNASSRHILIGIDSGPARCGMWLLATTSQNVMIYKTVVQGENLTPSASNNTFSVTHGAGTVQYLDIPIDPALNPLTIS